MSLKDSSKSVTSEPVAAPPELWLCNSAGASFPTAGCHEAACLTGQAKGVGHGEQPAHPHTPWRNDQAADIVYR